jgi:DNA-binding beta-propeller fold protein YncE
VFARGPSLPRRPGASLRVLTAVVALAACALLAAAPADADAAKRKREVIFVGNNWAGTADVLLASRKRHYRRVARLNIIPDFDERMDEIQNPLNPNYDPTRLPFFVGINLLIGEGNNQYVDDMYSSNDGRLLIVSRPSFKDVVAINIRTGKLVWRFEVDGQRSDHMAISPDGREVAVSASTGNVVHILRTTTGEEIGRFPSGDSPHENSYSADGERIYHASIGLVYTPLDQPELDDTKGERYFQVVDADTDEVLSRVDMGQKLEEAGYPGMSAAVRPMALTPNERKAYLQISFFHGFVEYDLEQGKVTKVIEMPNEVPNLPREAYLLDSAHHGIAMSGNGRKLCVAGTMSDYAAIVRRGQGFRHKLFHKGTKPYWSTTSKDGKLCYVSWSGTDSISVFSYRKEREIAHIEVGDHPQRIRTGFVRRSWLRGLR